MIEVSFIGPADQPIGRKRLLDELRGSLQSDDFSHLRIMVAFAKAGPLLRLQPDIERRRAKGFSIEAIIGIDQQGTSLQALAFALKHFNRVFITREPNLTFHPKIYVFMGAKKARLYLGSSNLTVGGTETNFEACIRLDVTLPAAKELWGSVDKCWNDLQPSNCAATRVLDNALLTELIQNGTVPDEAKMRRIGTTGTPGTVGPKPTRSGLKVKPPSALPKNAAIKPTSVQSITPKPDNFAAEGFAIQIKPHHNGEIFLSVTAALQNPSFFKWPFTGLTIPKFGSNKAYPQLTPDPRVNISVYGANFPTPIKQLPNYALNTVYYAKKSEIRITASPLVETVPEYSVMIMRRSDLPGIDYDIVIHTPASPEYDSWVTACNQQMPGGGQKPRKFGWF